MRKCRICGIQIAAKPLAIRENLEKMALWAEKAVDEFAPDLIVFPETITTGFSPGISFKEFLKIVEKVPGHSTDFISSLCKKLKVDILLPMYEKRRNKIYNSAIYINKKGKILGIYRKLHPFSTERIENNGWSSAGKDIVVVNAGFARIGLMICYDGDFPELSRILALRGAEIIVRPSAFLRSFDIWELTNKARAYDNHVYMVAVNSVGKDAAGNFYFGNSMIVDPSAHKIALARGGEEILFAEFETDKKETISYGVSQVRNFNHLKDRNVNSYTDELLRLYSKKGFN